MACCASAFRGDLRASADRALWSVFFAGLLFHPDEYHIYSVQTYPNFLTQIQNLETSGIT